MKKTDKKSPQNKAKVNAPFFDKSATTSFFDSPKSMPYFNIQPKLSIGQSDSPLEKEADQVADQVIANNTAAPALQAKCENCAGQDEPIPIQRMEEEEEAIQAKSGHSMEEEEELQLKPILRQEEEERVQMKPESNAGVPGANFSNKLGQKKGRGSTLPSSTLKEMNQSFGADFSRVSIHTDGEAQRMSQEIKAQAFTYGQDIFFNRNKFNPGSKSGKHLLAHELTHVLQQNTNIQRQDEEATTGTVTKSWSEKVSDADSKSGADKNSAYAQLIKDAVGSGYKVHESTNDAASIEEGAKAGKYKEWGADKDVNYDANFNDKSNVDANQYGQAQYVHIDGNYQIFIVLGPNAINSSAGSVFTQMANDHEQGHAKDFKDQMKTGDPHAATEGEELAIYSAGLTNYLLDLVLLDKQECTFEVTEGFFNVFHTYVNATDTEQKSAFASIKSFYENTVKGKGDSETKFKIWFQYMVDNFGVEHKLVKKINALDGLSLKKDTDPSEHFQCQDE